MAIARDRQQALEGLGTVDAMELLGGEELARVLERLPQFIADAVLTQATRAGANVIKAEMERERKARGWDLAGGFRTKKLFGRGRSVAIAVAPPPDAFYVLFLEFGTVKMRAQPIMRPAFDAKREEAVQVIGQRLGKAIEREARKLSGRFGALGRTRRRRLGRS